MKEIKTVIQEIIDAQNADPFDAEATTDALTDALELLEKQPEIVLCKDCISWDKGHTEECNNLDSICFHNGWCKPDWFCADGEKAVRLNE